LLTIHLNSKDWSTQQAVISRGARSADAVPPSDFPRSFLTEDSEVAQEFTAQPKAATRGQAAPAGPLDFSCDLAPDEAAILAIRHPSGALTFHLPVQSSSRGLRQPNQVRFVVNVRSADVDSGTRGIVTKAVKAVVIKVGKALGDKVTSFLLPKLVAAFEKDSWSKHGLQEGWVKVTPETLAKGLEPGKPVSSDRSLLLIHGTFSNAKSAYGSLVTSNFFDRIKSTYGDRIFAFDHFTLSRTPEENARMLLQGLPEQTTTFDVITHSRGGLVLRNLVERAGQFEPLVQRFKLGRAVLVASPNEGTPLATPERWKDTIGWMANLLELFPDNPFTTGAAFVANGLVWLAKHASGDIPGLHSMDGNGELIAALQAPPAPPVDAFSALVSNYNPTGNVLLRMIDAGIDQFFGSANDLVVPTEGGWRVARPWKPFIPAVRIGCYGPGGNLSADSVTHVNFFSRPETVDFLVKALAGEPQPLRRIDPQAALPDRRMVRGGTAPFAAATAPPPATPRVFSAGEAAPPPADVPHRADENVLKVTVINGDLTFEKDPLLVGHYRATRLTGTERIMNELIGGAMKRSLDMGLYPLAPGSHQIFLNTQPNPESPKGLPRPKAVVVVGLGDEGKLKASDLAKTVRQAVVAWAQRTTEVDKKQPATLDLVATLIGSGGTGITAAESAQRIVQGAYEANELLTGKAGSSDKNWPLVRHLRLIELYLDRASEAWRALKMLTASSTGRYELTPDIKVGTGPLTRPPEFGYRGADYDFITALTAENKDGAKSIQYTLDTKRARSEVRAKTTQALLLRNLISSASNAQNHDPQIGRSLFQLLVPIEIESFLDGSCEMQIELDTDTAAIPWELLDSARADQRSADTRPWSIRTKLLRKLQVKEYRMEVRDADADSSILVIGEPECPKEYPRLPGAQQEAADVYKCLIESGAMEGDRVKQLFADSPADLGPDARAVINALLERDWRIVHISGHGQLGDSDAEPGGVVLTNGTFLGPNEINTMRSVPELVFVNCCHLAAHPAEQFLSYDRAEFASGVADKLIQIGVRCVIAAGWAVDDFAASRFAKTFYRSLLAGNRFIDAVAEAREAIYSTEDNTWAAYQCYGDPDWVFRRDTAEADAPRSPLGNEFANIASATGLKLALEAIAVQTTFQKYEPKAQLERIRILEERFAVRWGKIGSVAELFGKAHASAHDAAGAIRWYELAVDAEDATASVKAAEQLANVRVRSAWEAVKNAQDHLQRVSSRLKAARARSPEARKARADANRAVRAARTAVRNSLSSGRKSIKDAMTLIEKLIAVNPTAERESIYGSAYKRAALIEAAAGHTKAERQAIQAMQYHYYEAVKIAGLNDTPEEAAQRTDRPDFAYPALNYLAAELVLNAGRRRRKELDKAVVEKTKQYIEEKTTDDPDFWSVVGQTELELYLTLANGTFAKESESFAKAYRNLYRRVTSPWMWSSVYDTLHFVLQIYRSRRSTRESRAAEALLASMAPFAESK
jgi:hypothetical protein